LTGVAKVASTSSANPSLRASVATGRRSITRTSGLVGVSTKIARVVLRIDLRQSRTLSGRTYDTSIPSRANS
jgi:hypothetical protein